MKTLKYNLVFNPEPEGGFTVTVPALPGVVSYGKNLTSAKAMVTDAIEGYLKVLQKHKKNIPSDANSFITTAEFILPSIKKTTVHAKVARTHI